MVTFLLTDPNQKNHVTGENGTVGSVFHWEGVDEKSLGSQTISELNTNEYAKMGCSILKPFTSSPTFEYFLAERVAGIEVKQVFHMEMGRFSYFMGKIFGMVKDISNTNQKGLERLKAVLEGKPL